MTEKLGHFQGLRTTTKAALAGLLLAGGAALALAPGAAQADDLVEVTVVDEIAIPQSLTGKAGDPAKGREVAINRRKGNCLGCHVMPIPEQAFHGQIGPELNGVADRYTEGELRLLVVNPKVNNPYTIMPAFYRVHDLNRVMPSFDQKTILTAEEVEDVVAYLLTLKE